VKKIGFLQLYYRGNRRNCHDENELEEFMPTKSAQQNTLSSIFLSDILVKDDKKNHMLRESLPFRDLKIVSITEDLFVGVSSLQSEEKTPQKYLTFKSVAITMPEITRIAGNMPF
jgi:hypothetical protein